MTVAIWIKWVNHCFWPGILVDQSQKSAADAIINVNKSDFQLYMARHKARQKEGDELRGAIKEINTLKQELFEIKKMIKEGFKK